MSIEFGSIQEYHLRGAQDVVLFNVEVDRGTINRDSDCTLCHDQAIKWAKAKVHVYSDSVLCLGKMHRHSEASEKW